MRFVLLFLVVYVTIGLTSAGLLPKPPQLPSLPNPFAPKVSSSPAPPPIPTDEQPDDGEPPADVSSHARGPGENPGSPQAPAAPELLPTDGVSESFNPFSPRILTDAVRKVQSTLQSSPVFKTFMRQLHKKQVFIEKDNDGQILTRKMVEIITAPNIVEVGPPKVIGCKVYGDEEQVKGKLGSDELKQKPPKHVTGKVMVSLVEKCQRHTLQQLADQSRARLNQTEGSNNSTESESDEGSSFIKGLVIYPGTKWCGAGDIADNFDDLGWDSKADACCREHDHCADSIKAGATKYNLTNTDSYTKSNCNCDAKFAECLKSANSYIGHQVGRSYFNVIQIQCFKNEFPIVKCNQEKGFLYNNVRTTCQEYELDNTQEKRVQFFDPPFYDGDSGPLINIPVISDTFNEPIKEIKDKAINGGIFGTVVG